MAITRREFLLEPGEELLFSRSAFSVLDRFSAFLTASGLDAGDVLSHPLCTTPLPVARRAGDSGAARFSGADPAFLWHPLMWLPADTALRYSVRDAPGQDAPRVETDAEWAVRVCLQLGESGLYDPANGGWLDVMALHGFDIGDRAVLVRASAWLHGAPDRGFDRICLDDVIGPDSAHWAFQEAHELARELEPAQFEALAEDLIAQIDRFGEDAVRVAAESIFATAVTGGLREFLDGRSGSPHTPRSGSAGGPALKDGEECASSRHRPVVCRDADHGGSLL